MRSEGSGLKKSVFYDKCFRYACVSVVLATVGWGIYTALSDSGLISEAAIFSPDSNAGKVLSEIKKYL